MAGTNSSKCWYCGNQLSFPSLHTDAVHTAWGTGEAWLNPELTLGQTKTRKILVFLVQFGVESKELQNFFNNAEKNCRTDTGSAHCSIRFDNVQLAQ
jgi:hypothetical protein